MKRRSLIAGLDLEYQDKNRIKKCSKCGAEIVFLKSKKGNWYPVNFLGVCDVNITDFHKCK